MCRDAGNTRNRFELLRQTLEPRIALNVLVNLAIHIPDHPGEKSQTFANALLEIFHPCLRQPVFFLHKHIRKLPSAGGEFLKFQLMGVAIFPGGV